MKNGNEGIASSNAYYVGYEAVWPSRMVIPDERRVAAKPGKQQAERREEGAGSHGLCRGCSHAGHGGRQLCCEP